MTGLGEFTRVLLVPPPLIFVLAFDEFAETSIALAFPDSWAAHVDVGHITIAHHALNTNFLLRGRIPWFVDVLHLLWGDNGRIGTVEGLSRAGGGLLGGGRRRARWEDLGLLRVHIRL